MPSFKLGDRVAKSSRPGDCGTIVAVVDRGPEDVRYRIEWDHAPTLVAESALVSCAASGMSGSS